MTITIHITIILTNIKNIDKIYHVSLVNLVNAHYIIYIYISTYLRHTVTVIYKSVHNLSSYKN